MHTLFPPLRCKLTPTHAHPCPHMLQFKRAYKRNDKPVCIAASMFIAHLANQQVGDRNTGFGHSVVSAAVFYGKAQAFVSHLLLLWANLRPSWPCLPLLAPLSNTHTGQHPFPIIATLTSHLTAIAPSPPFLCTGGPRAAPAGGVAAAAGGSQRRQRGDGG